uniref:hypothetical protein n=1 Tax=uncultured Duncaniella sp. TaxID=2768039 RepID=UPI0026F2B85D
ESLKGLSEFMKREITTEPLEEEYYASLRAKIPDYIDIPTNDLSRKSRSLLFDMGIYLGEVFIRTHHKLRWEQNKYKEADRGYMVIRINDGLAPFFSPLWVIFILGGKVTDNTFVENGLLDVYNIYSGRLSENYR